MAVVDLSELITDLEISVTPPGGNKYPTVSEEEWVDRLRGAFWDASLDGLVPGFQERDGVVSPITGDAEFTREMQQIVIIYAGMTIIRNEIRGLNTLFRAKSGTNEYEVQQSATVLKAILDEFAARLDRVLDRLVSSTYQGSFYIDGVVSRVNAINSGITGWIE